MRRFARKGLDDVVVERGELSIVSPPRISTTTLPLPDHIARAMADGSVMAVGRIPR